MVAFGARGGRGGWKCTDEGWEMARAGRDRVHPHPRCLAKGVDTESWRMRWRRWWKMEEEEEKRREERKAEERRGEEKRREESEETGWSREDGHFGMSRETATPPGRP
uniref:Uncharacterized protein n=1 Tax=Vespula pensylvanica TaxID=30213 RepID=A0A834PGM2_VESPE|nr:hypothetical protein H0235_001922 [Vespula pensylvanica]